MNYEFNVGQTVVLNYGTMSGTVQSMVPGNGSIPWYYVEWSDGSVTRHTADELVAV